MGFLDGLNDKAEAEAEVSATETAADEVGDLGEAPAADPSDATVQAADIGKDPAEPTPDHTS